MGIQLSKKKFKLNPWPKPNILHKKQNSFSWRDQDQQSQNAVQCPCGKCDFKLWLQANQGQELCLTSCTPARHRGKGSVFVVRRQSEHNILFPSGYVHVESDLAEM